MDKSKENTLKGLLEVIEWISDKNYQRRVWIKAHGPEVNDFDETVNFFFGIGSPVLKNYKEFEITDNQYQILKEFRDRFEEFSDGPALEYYLPEVFIDTPEWTKITEMAQEVLIAFNWKNSSIPVPFERHPRKPN